VVSRGRGQIIEQLLHCITYDLTIGTYHNLT